MFAFYLCSQLCKKQSEEITWIPCYLCCQRIPIKNWIDSSHRFSCMSTHRARMESHHLVTDPSLKCAKCSGFLRRWTSHRMSNLPGNNTFICEMCHPNTDPLRRYPSKEVVNTLSNRYNCFKCDYDICSTCAEKNRVSALGQAKALETKNTTSMFTNGPFFTRNFSKNKVSALGQ